MYQSVQVGPSIKTTWHCTGCQDHNTLQWSNNDQVVKHICKNRKLINSADCYLVIGYSDETPADCPYLKNSSTKI
jgi:hypothetical protein